MTAPVICVTGPYLDAHVGEGYWMGVSLGLRATEAHCSPGELSPGCKIRAPEWVSREIVLAPP